MPKVIELVNLPPTITWGILEPLAVSLLTAAAGAVLLAGALSLSGRGESSRRLLYLTGAAATITGLGLITMSLGSPLHLYMFMVTPSFSSWTTIGTFLLPLFLVATLLSLRQDDSGHAFRAYASGVAMLLALGVLVYASREIGYLRGRTMWHWKLLPLVFAIAGIAGGAGLAGVLGMLRRMRSPAWLLVVMASASLFCAAATDLFSPPAGYALSHGAFWNGFAFVGVAAALFCLTALRFRALSPLAGLLTYGSGLAFYTKLIVLGQSIPRNAFTPVDAEAMNQLLSVQVALYVCGSLAFLLLLGMLLAGVFSNFIVAQGGRSHG